MSADRHSRANCTAPSVARATSCDDLQTQAGVDPAPQSGRTLSSAIFCALAASATSTPPVRISVTARPRAANSPNAAPTPRGWPPCSTDSTRSTRTRGIAGRCAAVHRRVYQARATGLIGGAQGGGTDCSSKTASNRRVVAQAVLAPKIGPDGIIADDRSAH
jgi:hypothetical protein